MPNHKLTLPGHEAAAKVQRLLNNLPGDLQVTLRKEFREPGGTSRRVAYADGVLAISGGKKTGLELAQQLYSLDLASPSLLQRFKGMLAGLGVVQEEVWDVEACAEARLWMTLTGLYVRTLGPGHAPRHLHRPPAHLHAWVFEIDSHFRPKEDSPCRTCRQWVRKEFLTFNGTE